MRIQKNLMIDNALEKMTGELDIKKLMDHYREFEKLKSVIMQNDQIALLSFLPKPKIYSDDLAESDKIQEKKTSKEVQFDKFLYVV